MICSKICNYPFKIKWTKHTLIVIDHVCEVFQVHYFLCVETNSGRVKLYCLGEKELIWAWGKFVECSAPANALHL